MAAMLATFGDEEVLLAMTLKKLLIVLAIFFMVAPGHLVAKPAKKSVGVTKPLYLYSENGVYYYQAELSRAEKASGQVASPVIGYRYYGKNQIGEHILVKVSDNGDVIAFAYCKSPCLVIRSTDSGRFVNDRRLVVSSAITDAIRGKLRNTNPELSKIKPKPISIPSRAPLQDGIKYEIIKGPTRVTILAAANTPVYATADGVVTFAGPMKGLGTAIRIGHGGEIESWYGNLARNTISAEAKVKKGDIIGYVAAALNGESSGLIYEVRIANTPVNPIPYMNGKDQESRSLFGSWQEQDVPASPKP